MLLRETMSLSDFIDNADHVGFGKRAIEEMAKKQLEQKKDYNHIVRNTMFIIPKGTIARYFADKEALAREKERTEAAQKKAAKAARSVKASGGKGRSGARKS